MNNYYASPADLAPGTKARAGDINTIDQSVDAAFDKLPAELALKSGTVNYAVNKGAANAYAVDLAAAITAYADGLEVKMLPGADNTGACTLNVNGLGAIAIKRQDGTNAQAGDLVGASPITLVYSAGTNTFRLPPLANAQVTAAAASATAAAASASAASTSAGQASASATAAATSATNAAGSATAAGNSATAASTSAGNAATSASQASGSAQSAATSAQNLAAAVTSASTSAGNASTSAGAAAGSATAASTSAGQASASATAANTSATNAATSASQASTSATNAANSATAAANSATGAATSAGLAAANAMLAKEGLTSIAQQFHTGYIVDVFLYDTSKDSDGGAWRKRCKHTSWENEALVPGKWLGQFGSTGAAVAAGGVVGDYFQYTGDNAFYQITSASPATAIPNIYRGNTREFPAVALIVAEASRIVIYDATQPTMPMWMVFVGTANSGMVRSPITAIAMVNAQLFVGYSTNQALTDVRFTADDGFLYWVSSTYSGYYAGRIKARNDNNSFIQPNSSRGYLTNQSVNDVAAIVLQDAPVDQATGLPVPTAVVGTNAGVTVLKHDSTAANWITNVGTIGAVGIDSRGWLTATGGGGNAYKSWLKYSIPASGATDQTSDLIFSQGSIPPRPGTDGNTGPFTALAIAKTYKALGSQNLYMPAPLTLLKDNPASVVKSMVAYINNAYSSGWLVGDSRGAWLADTVAETVAATTILSAADSTYDAGKGAWISQSSATTTWDAANGIGGSGCVKCTATGGSNILSTLPLTGLVPGKSYVVVFAAKDANNTNFSTFYVSTGGYNSGTSLTNAGIQLSPAYGTYSLHFTATQALSYFSVYAGNGNSDSVYLDSVQVFLADSDRSAKNNHMVINGSLNKAAVNVGSQLVGYSGFGNSNYLSMPYNGNEDFGAADFCVMGWAKMTAQNSFSFMQQVTAAGNTNNWIDKRWDFFYYAPTQVLAFQPGTPVGAGVSVAYNFYVNPTRFVFLCAVVSGGTVKIYVDGQLFTSGAVNLQNTYANTIIGGMPAGFAASDSAVLALWRLTGTAPSADQIAQIYRDELQLFQPGAQCTIDGNNNQVTALAYDDVTDLLHVGTTWGRSAFKGLQRTESSATQVGSVTAISGALGAHITGGASGARFYQPAITLRDELRRKDEARQALGRIPVPLWRTGDGATAAYQLPVGFVPYAVYRQGLLVRDQGNDYTASFDGYRWTVTFLANVPNNYNICIMGVRNGAN